MQKYPPKLERIPPILPSILPIWLTAASSYNACATSSYVQSSSNPTTRYQTYLQHIKIILYLGLRSQIYTKYGSEPLLLIIYALRVNTFYTSQQFCKVGDFTQIVKSFNKQICIISTNISLYGHCSTNF